MFPCGLKWRIHQQCHPWSSAAGTATQYTSVGIWKIRYEPNHIPTKICWSDFLPCYLLTPEVPLILHTDVTAHTVLQSKSKKINSRLSVCNFPVQTSAGVEQTAPAGFMSTGCSELIPLNLILKTVWRTTANHPEKRIQRWSNSRLLWRFDNPEMAAWIFTARCNSVPFNPHASCACAVSASSLL